MRGTEFAALRISPTDFVGPTTLQHAKTYWLGDSWLEGAFDVTTLNNFGQRASLMLNFHHYQAGQGGTGYTNNGGGGTKAPYTDAARLAAIGTVKPDYVIVEGSINDDSATPSAITAAATSVYSQIAALSPNSKIIVIGPQSTGNTVSAGRAANRTALQAAATAAPNVIGFIDANAEAWVTGTGKMGATTSDGPADYMVQTDGSHLSAVGADIYGRRAAAAIAKLITA
jgi:lysophospholipase L1-like esterase